MKFLKYLMILILSLLSLLSILVLALYFNLGLILNIDRFKYALDKFEVFKKYSWAEGIIEFENKGMFAKEIKIDFKDFCFDYDKNFTKAYGCLSKIYLKGELSLTPPFIVYQTDFILTSKIITIIKNEDPNPPQESEGSLIDLEKYYSYLWNPFIPPLDIVIEKIALNLSDKKIDFPLSILKKKNALSIKSAPIEFVAIDKGIQVFITEEVKLPIKNYSLYLKKAALNISVGKDINLSFFSLLEFIEFSFQSKMPAVFHTDKIQNLTANLLNNLKLHLFLPELKKNMAQTLFPPYNTLPAPLNEMEGDLAFKFSFSPLSDHLHQGNGDLSLKLKSKNQDLYLTITPELKLSSLDFSLSDISLNVDFHKVLIELPKFSKTSLPPQFIPDSRFKSAANFTQTTKKKEKPIKLDLLVKAENEKSLQLKTNFIDSIIRLNLNFLIEESEIVKGYVRLLPLEFKLLKRPVKIEDLWINFKGNKLPEINSHISFNLPEYKIKLLLQGVLNSPRYIFESEPPLPQSDIYSVLLFGRPLSDMGSDSNMATQQTRQLISQGLLSLTVLYILSGTPIEYIGYDAEAKETSAQFGLGSKSSLHVSSGEGGRSTGVRRSLGKGWYLDTSVQSPSDKANSSNAQDYGLFLERIISY